MIPENIEMVAVDSQNVTDTESKLDFEIKVYAIVVLFCFFSYWSYLIGWWT